uniref:Uncharacterized protein n=1 Tax=uncultured prokaryote TaxID=198431 RepID=A0A0H5Q3K9_9ZZZZ|nr:hypothetical protein [uncultured prokaryote]
MSWPTYSVVFLAYHGAPATITYTVPAGMTAIVRQATYWDTSSDGQANVTAGEPPDNTEFTFAVLAPPSGGAVATWTGRIVVGAGGYIRVYNVSGQVDPAIYVGGYLLGAG